MGEQDIVRELEGLRLEYVRYGKLKVIALCLVFPGFFIGGILGFLLLGEVGVLLGFASFFAFWGLHKIADNKRIECQREFRELYKGCFVKSVIKDMADNVVYEAKKGFSQEYMDRLMLVANGRRFASEDYIKASYHKVRFEQSDVIVLGRGNTHNHQDVVYFRGQVVVIENLPKKVKHVQIYTKNFGHRGNTQVPMHHIQTEDVEFNGEFQVWSEDSEEAMYILLPPLMERIKELRVKYRAIAIHFFNNKVAFGFEYQEGTTSFEADMSKEINYEQEKLRMRSYMQEIIELIHLLELVDE